MSDQAASSTLSSSLPLYATVEQVAAVTQYSEKTIVRMLADGRLKGVRSHPGRGGRWRICRKSVLALMGS